MSRYRSYGKLDDSFVTEGDTFFTHMNTRLRPSQLNAGEVALSLNGRMEVDGTWQPRKGLKTLAGAITIDADAIRLPFPISAAFRSNNVVTITLVDTPNQGFLPNENFTINGLGFTILDPNSTHLLTSVNYENKIITFAQNGDDEVFTVNSESVASPGNSIATQLDFIINNAGANEVYGTTSFSQVYNDKVESFAFTATNNICQIIRLSDGEVFKVRYPTNITVSTRCELVQAFNKMFIFRGSQTTLFSSPTLTTLDIDSASRNNQTITVGVTAHGKSVDEFITISGLGNWQVGGNPNGIYQIQSVPDPDTLTITFNTSDGSETYYTSGAKLEFFNDFELVDFGDYTYPEHIADTNVSIGTTGIGTFNELAHGLSVGDELQVVKADSPLDLPFEGKSIRISRVPNDNSFEFFAGTDVATNLNMVLAKKKAVSFLEHMPASPFAVVNQQRLWMPYFYTSEEVPTRRQNTDELIASDILDHNTYDIIGQKFRIASGGNDYIVGIEPFTEDTLLIFNRNSIYRLGGVSGSLKDTNLQVIHPDFGCAARRSIVQVSNKVYFLSDQGMYGFEYFDQFNLRGLEVPLSESINTIVERINKEAIDKAVTKYFNNRLWWAIPVDGSNENNMICVYSLLNNGWESFDQVNSQLFNIRDMIVAKEGSKQNLYITTSEGGIHQIDGTDGGDQISVVAGVSIPKLIDIESKLVTREYDANIIDRKMFSSAELHFKSTTTNTSDADISFTTSDPDSTRSGISISSSLGSELSANEDASIRTPIRLRGFGCQATITPTTNRPFVRAVKVDARITDKSITSEK
jgi:hypothetical protein